MSTLIGNAHTSVTTMLKVSPSNGILVGLSANADNAKMTAPTATRKTAVRRLNMRLLRCKDARLMEFVRNRVVIFVVFIWMRLDCLICVNEPFAHGLPCGKKVR